MIELEKYLYLMKKIAGEYYWKKNSKYEFDDLYQSACLGLVKAGNAFNSEKGIEFSTLAYKCAHNEILRLYETDSRKMRKAQTYSLDYEYSINNKAVTLQEYLEDETYNKYWEEDFIEHIELKQAISKLLQSEKEVLLLFFFFDLNCGQIAKMKGYSPSNANRLKRNAIKKIREALGVTGKVDVKKRFSKRGYSNGKCKKA